MKSRKVLRQKVDDHVDLDAQLARAAVAHTRACQFPNASCCVEKVLLGQTFSE